MSVIGAAALVAEILSYVGPAAKLLMDVQSIIERMEAGDLTEAQAAAEWEKTRAMHAKGLADWRNA